MRTITLAICLCIGSAVLVLGVTLNVGTAETYTTAAGAVAAANPGDTINIVDALHTEAGIVIDKDLIIQGQGINTTTLQAAASRGTASDRVFFINSGTTVEIRDMTIRYGHTPDGATAGESSEDGGGVYNSGTLTMTNCRISENDTGHGADNGSGDGGCSGSGAGIFTDGNLVLDQCAVDNNKTGNGGNGSTSGGGAGYGGGIFCDSTGSITMTGGSLSSNQTGLTGTPENGVYWTCGGGISSYGTSIELYGVTLSGNTNDHLYGFGTCVDIQSPVIFEDCLFSTNSGQSVGAVSVRGYAATINRCCIHSNTGDGPGLELEGSGVTWDITNTTVAGNDGGGITFVGSNTANLMFCTIAGNSTTLDGGGLRNISSTVNIKNTLIADNTASSSGPDIFGEITSLDYNLIEDTSGGTIVGTTANNITGQDPLLSALADNGGPTPTISIETSSPACNNGVEETGISTDQRGTGFSRSSGAAPDIGAFEYQEPSSSSNSDSDGGCLVNREHNSNLFLMFIACVSILFRIATHKNLFCR